MTDTDTQILESLLSALEDPGKWAFVPHFRGSSSWIKRGKVHVKACKHMGPSDPWNYLCVVVGDDDWKIPYEMRRHFWEKAHPVFEAIRASADSGTRSSILQGIRSLF